MVGTTTISLKNEVSICRKMYYDKETWVVVNLSVNEFYTRFLFRIDALQHDSAFPLGITANFFKKFITDVRELLISEGFQVTLRPPTETNNEVNQRLILFINVSV